MPSLFDPIRLGAITAPNRILMAPLTRGRNTRDFVPTPLMIEYYTQRASAGLIISEATGISRQGMGWPFGPGIWTAEQVGGWRAVVDAVHQAGGRIVSQLWHMGRLVHPDFLDGAAPVSSSATTAPSHAYTYAGKQPYGEARAMRRDEIPGLLDDYRAAARNAMAAGFDGVQIHAANGYLIDQFLRDNSNFRDDAYGGSVDNRVRLLREVTQAVADVVGADRTGVRLSPNGDSQGANDSDPHVLFAAAAAALSAIGIAFLELREPGMDGTFGKAEVPPVAPVIRQAFTGALVLNSDYDHGRAQAALDAGEADAIAFGRKFISNPDLPHRFAAGLRLPLTCLPRGIPKGKRATPTIRPQPEGAYAQRSWAAITRIAAQSSQLVEIWRKNRRADFGQTCDADAMMEQDRSIAVPASHASPASVQPLPGLDAQDWDGAGAALDRQGWAVLPGILTPDQCRGLAGLYGDAARFRSRVLMARHGFGQGEYQYFAYPLPDLVAGLRVALYSRLAPIANRWNDTLAIETRYPAALGEFLGRCHGAGQTRPTPLLLQYGPGDYNCLHQDLYGAHVFPLQVVLLLSEPGRDFEGGEFVLTEQRPRMQSRAAVVPMRQGDACVFAVHHRPVRGARGPYRVVMRHGVSVLRAGHRHTAGIIFHDAA